MGQEGSGRSITKGDVEMATEKKIQSSGPAIREAEQPALSFEWGAIKWLCNQEIEPEALQTFGLVFINPGQQNPPHYHPNCEELIYVLSGECDHRLGDATVRLEPGSPPDRVIVSTRIGLAEGKGDQTPWRFIDADLMQWASKPHPK